MIFFYRYKENPAVGDNNYHPQLSDIIENKS
jgi:hypothetical protein